MFKWGIKPHEVEDFWALPQFIQALCIVYIETMDDWEYVKSLEANRKASKPSNQRTGSSNGNGMELE